MATVSRAVSKSSQLKARHPFLEPLKSSFPKINSKGLLLSSGKNLISAIPNLLSFQKIKFELKFKKLKARLFKFWRIKLLCKLTRKILSGANAHSLKFKKLSKLCNFLNSTFKVKDIRSLN
jgi:hypothetical protein